LTQFLTDRKHGQLLEAWDTDFTVQSRNEAHKKVQKISKIQSDQKGASNHRPPEYATEH